ncbi:zinc finger protein 2 isoform X1 [Oreochromis niloticus]|uniref:zinc finger protein 2 isoform X1 n=1 Tax=Oreochromis niloticus TaxID=8128 RepID=UPI000393F5A0|nr:zinc finger protein 2 isoform X1 [Oreochromis niloticus]
MSGNTADRLADMPKAEALREFVTEKLAAASREILAAVDRLVAGYEEEASGFRQEIDRQKRQLELLPHEATLNKAGSKCSRTFSPVEEEEGEKEESHENLQTADITGPSRSSPHQCETERRNLARAQNHIDLKISILEHSQTSLLFKNVLKKCPVLKLKCPRGQQEADFLNLLRSTCPQLAGDNKPFDILTLDKKRKLQPLKLETLTPEEIHRSITGWGRSTVYIRLKTQEVHQPREEDLHRLQTENMNSAVLTNDETRQQTSSLAQEIDGSKSEIASGREENEIEMGEADSEEPAADLIAGSAAEGKESFRNCNKRKEEKVEGNEKSKNELKRCDSKMQSRMSKKQKIRHPGITRTKTEKSVANLSCLVCGALHMSEVMLVKHAWSHGNDPGSVCGACGERSESVEVLKDHLQSRHKTDDCHICGESFLSALSLDEHVACHSGEKPYKCDVCHNEFALKASLEDHRKLHEEGKRHKCHICHKVFELKEQLKAHHRTHTNRKTHLCGVCGKSLCDYRSLSRHKMTHSGERPHGCKICGRRFKLPGTLRQHEKIHTNRERSYLCDICCKMFLTSAQLEIHMRIHTNEKPYHCSECGKGFSTKGPLTVHKRVHSGETPYHCPDCGWSFKRKTNLDNHLVLHSGIKPFVCGICGKACARKEYLTVHMRTHNGERPYKCTLCDKAFTQSHCLKTHMKSHQAPGSAT